MADAEEKAKQEKIAAARKRVSFATSIPPSRANAP